MIGHWLGLDNASGPVYLFWSGFFAATSLFAGVAAFLRHRNCEVHRCWRLGRHDTAAGHTVCRRHHPDDRLTAQDVRTAHDRANR